MRYEDNDFEELERLSCQGYQPRKEVPMSMKMAQAQMYKLLEDNAAARYAQMLRDESFGTWREWFFVAIIVIINLFYLI